MNEKYVEECKKFKWLQTYWHDRGWQFDDVVIQYPNTKGERVYIINKHVGGYCDMCSDVWLPRLSQLIELMGDGFIALAYDTIKIKGKVCRDWRCYYNDPEYKEWVFAETPELACLMALKKIHGGE